jgi:GDP-L-fucose synthase
MTKEIVLVTGGTGLVGHGIQSHMKKYMGKEFIFIGSKDVNLCNLEETLSYFQRIQPTYVIHLASNVGGLFKNMKYKVEMFEQNMRMTMNIFHAARLVNVKKLVSCLSTCIFPDKVEYPIQEEMLHDGPPHWSNDGYAYAKRMIDVLSSSYRTQYGCNFTCVIPCNVYGKYDNFSLEDGHVIPALIHKCYLASQNNESLKVKGSGKPLRQFIYADDLGELILWNLFEYEGSDNIILANEKEVSIGEVAEMVAGEFNVEVEYVEGEDGQYRKTVSTNLLKRLRPDFVGKDLKVALKETMEWFKENYEKVRK